MGMKVMKVIKVTITKELEDSLWGFSDLLECFKDATREEKEKELIDLLYEDMPEVLDGATFEFEGI